MAVGQFIILLLIWIDSRIDDLLLRGDSNQRNILPQAELLDPRANTGVKDESIGFESGPADACKSLTGPLRHGPR